MFKKTFVKLIFTNLFVLVFFLGSNKIAMSGCEWKASSGCVNWSCECTEDANCNGCACFSIGAFGECQTSSGEKGLGWCVPRDYCCSPVCCGQNWCCTGNDVPPDCGGGCFTPETQIKTSEGEGKIVDLEVGEELETYDFESNQKTDSLVEKIHEVSQSAYFKIKTEAGQELDVTAEHPLFAIQQEPKPLSFWEYLKTESLLKKIVDLFVE